MNTHASPDNECSGTTGAQTDVAELKDTVDDLKTTVEEQSSLIDALQKKVNHLEEELTEYREENERDKASIRQKVSNADEGDDSPDTNPNGDDRTTTDETPLTRLLDDPSGSAVRITKSVGRALTIAGNLDQWSDKIQGKRVLRDGLKDLLSATEHDRLKWKQAHRAAHKLAELTNGKVEFKKTNRHGRILVVEDLEWFNDVLRRQRGNGG